MVRLKSGMSSLERAISRLAVPAALLTARLNDAWNWGGVNSNCLAMSSSLEKSTSTSNNVIFIRALSCFFLTGVDKNGIIHFRIKEGAIDSPTTNQGDLRWQPEMTFPDTSHILD